MKKVQVERAKKRNIMAVLEECRKRGITIEDLLEFISATIESNVIEEAAEEENIEVRVSNLLKEIGVPVNIVGYEYLKYAIIYVLNNPESMFSVTKTLYPDIASHFYVRSSSVGHSIGRAIETAWDRGNVDILRSYFGYTVKTSRGKPTSREFIATLVEYLKISE